MGKIYPDDSNNPIPAVNTQGIETDAVKQLATGRAYVELLAMYRDNEEFAKASDEAKKELKLISNLFVNHNLDKEYKLEKY